MERDVAVIVELAHGDAQPEGRADLHDGVDGEAEEFTAADTGAGEQLDDESRQRIRVGARHAHELAGRGVVEEAGQRLVHDGQVPREQEWSPRRVRVVPVRDAVEEAVQVDEPVLDADPIERPAGVAPVLGAEPRLVGLEVSPFQLGAARHLRMGRREPGPELAQGMLDVADGRGDPLLAGVGLRCAWSAGTVTVPA